MLKALTRRKLVRDISANTVTSVVTQLFGLAIFYLISRYLSREDFGELNWLMAAGATIVAICSLGLDLVYVRRIAAGEDALKVCGIHFFHTLLAGALISVAALLAGNLSQKVSGAHPWLFIVFFHLALSNIAGSFRLALNGLEAYTNLAWLAVLTNLVKLSGITAIYLQGNFTLQQVVYAYILTSAFEIIAGYFILSRRLKRVIRPRLLIYDYRYFVIESLPQLGVVLFDSALARIDWILLGILSSAAVTADYSFAYKVFEIAKLPLLIIAPVLLTRFSRIYGKESGMISGEQKAEAAFFLKLEMFLLLFIPAVLSVCWSPLMALLTTGKYGHTNAMEFRILALCIPLVGMINYLWTLAFAQGQLRAILFITMAAAVINIAANLLLIPHYGSEGAALAYLGSTLVQFILYLASIKRRGIGFDLRTLALPLFAALVAVSAGILAGENVIFATVLTLIVYAGLCMLSRQLRPAYIVAKLKGEDLTEART